MFFHFQGISQNTPSDWTHGKFGSRSLTFPVGHGSCPVVHCGFVSSELKLSIFRQNSESSWFSLQRKSKIIWKVYFPVVRQVGGKSTIHIKSYIVVTDYETCNHVTGKMIRHGIMLINRGTQVITFIKDN